MDSKYKFEMGAGRPALDFCNSCDDRPGWISGDFAPRGEHLESTDDLTAWLQKAALLSRAERDALQRAGELSGRAAAAFLTRARELRELLFRAFYESQKKAALSKQTLDELNRWQRLVPPIVLAASGSGVKFEREAKISAEQVLVRIFADAVDLLGTPALERVKFCAAEDCGWLFFDSSKNGSRRWCDMTDCGNREKARRFQERHQ